MNWIEPKPGVMSAQEIAALLKEAAPHWGDLSSQILAVGHRYSRLRYDVDSMNLRPGGTVSGPTMFTLADSAFYMAVLASTGPHALAVTTTLTINFLRRPAAKALVCECRLLKLGKRLAVGDAMIYSEGEEEPVAHASGAYSLPPGA